VVLSGYSDYLHQ